MYHRVPQGRALVRSGFGGTHVFFRGALVWPVIQRAELVDISIKRIEISCTGENSVLCGDNIRADIIMAFFLRIMPEPDAVRRVCMVAGAERAGEEEYLLKLFRAKFVEAIKKVARGKVFEEHHLDQPVPAVSNTRSRRTEVVPQ